MFNQLLNKVPGADFPMIISLLVFTGFFSLVTLYILKADKKTIDKISRIPLDSERPETLTKEKQS